MFDAHNTQEGGDRFERGSEGPDPVAPSNSTEVSTDREDARTGRPRVICVGFAVFRI